jgi:hypothetical protein
MVSNRIRTYGRGMDPTLVFKTSALNRSAMLTFTERGSNPRYLHQKEASYH